MPTMSGPNPLSIGQYNAAGAATGAGDAAGGMSQLAGAMIGNPAATAQARYLGAETGRATAQTQQINDQQRDLATATQLLQDPNALKDPAKAQMVGALLIKYPQQAAALPGILAASMQGRLAAGDHTTVPQSAADQFSAGTGVAPMSNTATGQGRDLANRTQVAGIGAGATLGAARISADASMANERMSQEGLDRRTQVMTRDDKGQPVYAPAASAGGKPAYDSAVANTIAGNDSAYGNYQGPSGNTVRATNAQGAAQGLQPRPSDPGQVMATVQQDAVRPAAPPSPPSQLAQTMGGAPSPSSGTGVDAGTASQIRDAMIAQASGRPPPGASSPADAVAVDQMIVTRLKAMMPTSFGSNAPSQALLDPIRLQAAYIHDHDPNVRGDWNAAVTQAIQNVTGQGGAGLGYDQHLPSWLGGRPGPSEIIMKPGTQITWPRGMPVPPQYAQQAQPATAAPPAAGAQAAQPPAPAPAQPAAAAGGAPPPRALSALREGTPTTFANGQTWTLQGGKPVRVK